MKKSILKYITKYYGHQYYYISYEMIVKFMLENKINKIVKYESKNKLEIFFVNSKQEEFSRTYFIDDGHFRIRDRKIK